MSRPQRPWYLRAFVAISAWFTALFFLFWLLLLFKDGGAFHIVLGAALLGGSSFLARASSDNEFLEQACLACSLAGRGTAMFGLESVTNSIQVSAGIMLLAEPLWFFLDPGYASRLVAGLSAFTFLGVMLARHHEMEVLAVLVLLAAALVLWCWLLAWGRGLERWQAVWRPLGWAALLVLLGGSLGLASGGGRNAVVGTSAASWGLALMLGLSLAWMWREERPVLGAALLLLGALAWPMSSSPDVMAALLVGALGFHLRRRDLLALAGAALLAGLFGYYYRRHETLLVKAGMLAVSGGVLGLAALLLSGLKPLKGQGAGPALLAGHRKRLLAAAGLLLMLMLGLDSKAYLAEGGKSSGQAVNLRLAPVDPRDLLLGDHMVLRFEIEAKIEEALGAAPGQADPGWAWVTRDAAGTLAFAALDQGLEQPGHLRLRYGRQGERVSLGIAKAYFQEGDEPRFRAARYGRCRLQADGSLTWLGFAGEDLNAL